MLKPRAFPASFVVTLHLLFACSPTEPVANSNSAYPGPADTARNIAATKANPNSLSISPSFGVIRAAFVYADSGRPIRHQLFYAAKLLPLLGSPTGGYVPSLDTVSAPQAESDDRGNLVIPSLPPGRYVLALMTPLGPVLVIKANSNTEITFEVKAGEITDLGNNAILADSKLLEP